MVVASIFVGLLEHSAQLWCAHQYSITGEVIGKQPLNLLK